MNIKCAIFYTMYPETYNNNEKIDHTKHFKI